MRKKRTDVIEVNFHIGHKLHDQLCRLQAAGLNASAVARLAIRKCYNLPPDDDQSDHAFPKRVLLYLHPDEAQLLDTLVNKEGERSRASILRSLITTYLRTNAFAIDALF